MSDRLGEALCRWRVRRILPLIEGRLLDIGCGHNQLVRAYGGEGMGVDVHPWEGADMVLPDTADMPFEDGQFDTVTIVAALNHIPNRRDVLAEACRVLAADGRIIVTMITPMISRVWHFLRRPWDADQKERKMKPGEVYGLTGKQTQELLREAGFSLSYHSRFMLGINHLYLACKGPKET
jgi:SAM-dependent methyltransferase